MTRPVANPRRRPSVRIRPARRVPWGPVLTSCAAVVLAAGLATLAITSPPPAVIDGDGCIGGHTRRTLAVVLDSTDPLIAGQPRQVRAAVSAALDGLTPDDRVAVVEMAGKAAAETAPVIDACLPGSETNVERNRLKRRILEPMEREITEIGRRPEAPASPILETLLSLASDRTFNAPGNGLGNAPGVPGSHLRILLVSDGLQNSAAGSVYGRGVSFPSTASHPLEGVTVEMVILRNPRDAAIQARGVAKLVDWLRSAHAEVIYDPPRWIGVTTEVTP